LKTEELREEIFKRYHEGQDVTLNVTDERTKYSFEVKIIKFYPGCIHTKHNGYNECFTYFEFSEIAKPKTDLDTQTGRLQRRAYR
jgi:hypothetical protein